MVIASWIGLFGDSNIGLTMGLYLNYLAFILMVGFIIQKYIKKNEVKNYSLFIIGYLLLFVFNPLIIGYDHTLLTESVMPLLYLIFVMLCYLWYTKNYKDDKKKIIILNVVFCLLGVFIWFVKQPFMPAFLATYLIAAICSGVYFKNWKIFLQKLLSIGICFIMLILSINIWNAFIYNATGKSPNDLNGNYMSTSFLAGLNVFYYNIDKDTYCNDYYVENVDVSSKTRSKLIDFKNKNNNWCENVIIYEVRDKKNNHVANEVLYAKDRKPGIFNSMLFLVKQLFKHPKYVLGSYFYNYLAIADVQETDYSNGYRSSLVYSDKVIGENLSNGEYAFIPNQSNIRTEGNWDNLKAVSSEHKLTTPLLYINNSLCFYLYKLLTLLIIFMFTKYLIKFIITKKSIYFIITMLCSVHMFNTLFHVFAGAIIDRYIYPSYTLALLALMLIFVDIKNSKE